MNSHLEWAIDGMRIGVVTQRDSLAMLRDAWNELAGRRFFYRFEWHNAWLRHLCDSQRLRVLVARDRSSNVVGLLPLCQTRHAAFGNVLEFTAAGNVCTDFMTMLTDPPQMLEIARAFAQTVSDSEFRRRFGRIDLVELSGVVGDDPALNEWGQVLQRRGWGVESRALESTWRIDLTGGWEGLRKSVRKSIRRKINKAERRWTDADFHFEALRSREQIQTAWPDFVRLHQKRRNALGQDGCFADPRFDRFLRTATLELADQQMATMFRVCHLGRPLAIMLCFEMDDCLCMYQSGTETDLAHFEPGHLTNAWATHCAVEQGIRFFDFLRGDEPYKSQWGAQPTTLYRTRWVAPHLPSRLRHAAFRWGRRAVYWARDLQQHFPRQHGEAR